MSDDYTPRLGTKRTLSEVHPPMKPNNNIHAGDAVSAEGRGLEVFIATGKQCGDFVQVSNHAGDILAFRSGALHVIEES